jgi:hypothetical protein
MFMLAAPFEFADDSLPVTRVAAQAMFSRQPRPNNRFD